MLLIIYYNYEIELSVAMSENEAGSGGVFTGP